MSKAVKVKPPKISGHGGHVAKGGNDAGTTRLPRAAKAGKSVVANVTRFEAVMKAAELSGLLGEKRARIGGRISPALLEQAKKQTGIQTDTDLIEFALANIALDDDFGQIFEKVRGTVDPSLKLGF